MKSIAELQALATQVRRDILRMVYHAKSGHPGGSLGCTDFLVTLYTNIMKADPRYFTEKGGGEDMFFLSNGHISPAWYSVLARTGFFPISELATFRQVGSRLQGHPTNHYHLPGVRIASGSLGQGLSIAVGAAVAKKMNDDKQSVYVLTGDGELDEGQNWEAILFASANKVDNLIAVVDYNKKQIDGSTDDVCSLGDLRTKFEAFGWDVVEMNGNDIADVSDKMDVAKSKLHHRKPVVVLMHTEMGMGVDFMMGTHKWHGVAPNEEQVKVALAQLPETIGDY